MLNPPPSEKTFLGKRSANLCEIWTDRKVRFTVEIEEYPILICIPARSDPMQFCPFWEEVRQDFLFFLPRPNMVPLRRSNAEKRAQRVYVPIATEKVTHRSDVGGMGPRSPLVFAEDADGYGESCGYDE